MIGLTSFTIVIPLYNKAKYIEKALKSALNQNYQDFEIIVIDDGSIDKGADIVKRFDDDSIKLIQQENQGVSAARNKGIEKSKNELIAFLDADDEWLPNHLDVLVRLIKKFPEAGIYGTAYQKKNKKGKSWVPNFKEIPPFPWEGIVLDYFKAVANGPEVLWTSAIAVWKKVFAKVGFFCIGMRNGQDADMWFRIVRRYPVAFSREVTATYNLETKNSAVGRVKGKADFKSHYFVEWPNMRTKEDSYLNEYIAKKQLILLTELYLSGHRRQVRLALANVQTRLHRKAKLRLYLKTFLNNQKLKMLRNIRKKITGKSEISVNTDRFV